jgi:uncharacterized protein YoxC
MDLLNHFLDYTVISCSIDDLYDLSDLYDHDNTKVLKSGTLTDIIDQIKEKVDGVNEIIRDIKDITQNIKGIFQTIKNLKDSLDDKEKKIR